MSRRRLPFAIPLLALFFVALPASGIAPCAVRADQELESALSALVRASGAQREEVGICVIDDRGRVVAAIEADTPLKPASNQKLLVTAAALERLGPDWAYLTRIFASGPLAGGELQGDLRIYSNGEPNISGRFHDGDTLYLFKAWARALFDAGIRRVRGDIVADARAFDDERFNPGWPAADAGRWFCAEISPLSLNDNCVTVRVHPRDAGRAAEVELDPPSRHVRVEGAPTVGGGKPNLRIHRTIEPDALVLEIGGTIPAGTRNWYDEVAVSDPALFYARAFAQVLGATGIAVDGRARKRVELADAPSESENDAAAAASSAGTALDEDPPSVDSAGGPRPGADAATKDRPREPEPGPAKAASAAPGEHLLIEHRSPLTLDLPVINKRSQNLHAELLLKALGASVAGEGSVRGGERIVREFFARRAIDASGLTIADASGLSHSNRATARAIAALLAAAAREPWGETFRDSLAIAGVDGTLEKRFGSYPQLHGHVHGKTGTIRGVSALSGYVEREGRRYSFSILINSLPAGSVLQARRLEERIVERIHRALGP